MLLLLLLLPLLLLERRKKQTAWKEGHKVISIGSAGARAWNQSDSPKPMPKVSIGFDHAEFPEDHTENNFSGVVEILLSRTDKCISQWWELEENHPLWVTSGRCVFRCLPEFTHQGWMLVAHSNPLLHHWPNRWLLSLFPAPTLLRVFQGITSQVRTLSLKSLFKGYPSGKRYSENFIH